MKETVRPGQLWQYCSERLVIPLEDTTLGRDRTLGITVWVCIAWKIGKDRCYHKEWAWPDDNWKLLEDIP